MIVKQSSGLQEGVKSGTTHRYVHKLSGGLMIKEIQLMSGMMCVHVLGCSGFLFELSDLL